MPVRVCGGGKQFEIDDWPHNPGSVLQLTVPSSGGGHRLRAPGEWQKNV